MSKMDEWTENEVNRRKNLEYAMRSKMAETVESWQSGVLLTDELIRYLLDIRQETMSNFLMWAESDLRSLKARTEQA